MLLPLPETITAAAALLLVAALSAVVFKRIKIPYTIGLVLVGMVFYYVCGKVPQMQHFRLLRLNHDLIMYALLPSLIFSASINIDSKLLFRNFNPTFMLAGPGLVISTLIIGFTMYYFTPLDMAGAMLFGALISATDPVAVISLFELVGAPKRLRILVDGESLFNDATAIVMYTLVLKIVFSGTAFSVLTLGWAAYEFLFIFFGGFVVGAVAGYVMAQLILFIKDDPMVEIALSVIVAYCSFIFADRVMEVSGVMACLGAGIVISYYGSSRFSPKTKNYIRHFWEFVAFIANSYIFLLLGFTEDFYLIGSQISEISFLMNIVWGVIAILVSRAVIVFGICPLIGIRDKSKKIDWKYQLLMFWGGLRGAVPLALVFSLPANLPHRSLIIQITLGVVIFTLFVQGISISRLLHIFKLDRASLFQRFAKVQALLLSREAGMRKLKELASVWSFPEKAVVEIQDEYITKTKKQRLELNKIVKGEDGEKHSLRRSLWTQVLRAEKHALRELYDSGFIPERLFRNVDFCIGQQQESINCCKEQPPTLFCELFRKSRFKDILEKIRRLFKGKKYQAYVLNEDYLSCCALAICNLGARERLKGLVKDDFFKGYPGEVEKCKEFYDESFRQVSEYLDVLEAKHPDLLYSISYTTLQQMIYSNELKTIDELLENMEISEHIYNDLFTFFHQRIRENRKQLYEDILNRA
jgi:CPA1 family monovalent cation:H+ antiporter